MWFSKPFARMGIGKGEKSLVKKPARQSLFRRKKEKGEIFLIVYPKLRKPAELFYGHL